MTVALLPVPKARFFDASGAPLAGGKVYTYVAGTTTPKVTYADSTAATQNTNPVILNSSGEADIWLDGNYKISLHDANDVEIWTVDGVSGGSGISMQWLTVSGTDTIIGTPESAVNNYSTQQIFLFFAAATNTTSVTINISGLGAKTIRKGTGTNLDPGDIVAGGICAIYYDGTYFQLINPRNASVAESASDPTVNDDSTDGYAVGSLWINTTLDTIFTCVDNTAGAAVWKKQIVVEAWADLASSSTVDLGSVSSDNIRVTGTTTITSFGSTAPAGTRKFIRFAGVLTLTNNATSLILPSAANIVTAANDTCIAIALGSGNWIVTQYQRASGYAVIAPIFSASYTSSDQTITSAGSLTLAHSLGVAPKFVQLELVNTSSEGGFSSGDVVLIAASSGVGGSTAGTAAQFQSIKVDSTNINVRYGSATQPYQLARYDTGVIFNLTNASWKLRVKAWA